MNPPQPLSSERKGDVRLAEETMEHLKTQMQDAVTAGLAQFMTPENFEKFWAAAFVVMRKQATIKTGRFVIDSAGDVVKKGFWVTVAVVVVWSIGGLELVGKLLKSVRIVFGGG